MRLQQWIERRVTLFLDKLATSGGGHFGGRIPPEAHSAFTSPTIRIERSGLIGQVAGTPYLQRKRNFHQTTKKTSHQIPSAQRHNKEEISEPPSIERFRRCFICLDARPRPLVTQPQSCKRCAAESNARAATFGALLWFDLYASSLLRRMTMPRLLFTSPRSPEVPGFALRTQPTEITKHPALWTPHVGWSGGKRRAEEDSAKVRRIVKLIR